MTPARLPRIVIEDLPSLEHLTPEELELIFGAGLKPRLGIESLETRDLQAAGLTASFSNGLMWIGGTTGADAINIRSSGGAVSVDGVGIDVGGTTQSSVTGVQRIVVNSLGGGDQIYVGAAPAGGITVLTDGGRTVDLTGGQLTAMGSAGDDAFQVRRANSSVGAAVVAGLAARGAVLDTVSIPPNLLNRILVSSGTGNDFVRLAEVMPVALSSIRLDGGAGVDTVVAPAGTDVAPDAADVRAANLTQLAAQLGADVALQDAGVRQTWTRTGQYVEEKWGAAAGAGLTYVKTTWVSEAASQQNAYPVMRLMSQTDGKWVEEAFAPHAGADRYVITAWASQGVRNQNGTPLSREVEHPNRSWTREEWGGESKYRKTFWASDPLHDLGWFTTKQTEGHDRSWTREDWANNKYTRTFWATEALMNQGTPTSRFVVDLAWSQATPSNHVYFIDPGKVAWRFTPATGFQRIGENTVSIVIAANGVVTRNEANLKQTWLTNGQFVQEQFGGAARVVKTTFASFGGAMQSRLTQANDSSWTLETWNAGHKYQRTYWATEARMNAGTPNSRATEWRGGRWAEEVWGGNTRYSVTTRVSQGGAIKSWATETYDDIWTETWTADGQSWTNQSTVGYDLPSADVLTRTRQLWAAAAQYLTPEEAFQSVARDLWNGGVRDVGVIARAMTFELKATQLNIADAIFYGIRDGGTANSDLLKVVKGLAAVTTDAAAIGRTIRYQLNPSSGLTIDTGLAASALASSAARLQAASTALSLSATSVTQLAQQLGLDITLKGVNVGYAWQRDGQFVSEVWGGGYRYQKNTWASEGGVLRGRTTEWRGGRWVEEVWGGNTRYSVTTRVSQGGAIKSWAVEGHDGRWVEEWRGGNPDQWTNRWTAESDMPSADVLTRTRQLWAAAAQYLTPEEAFQSVARDLWNGGVRDVGVIARAMTFELKATQLNIADAIFYGIRDGGTPGTAYQKAAAAMGATTRAYGAIARTLQYQFGLNNTLIADAISYGLGDHGTPGTRFQNIARGLGSVCGDVDEIARLVYAEMRGLPLNILADAISYGLGDFGTPGARYQNVAKALGAVTSDLPTIVRTLRDQCNLNLTQIADAISYGVSSLWSAAVAGRGIHVNTIQISPDGTIYSTNTARELYRYVPGGAFVRIGVNVREFRALSDGGVIGLNTAGELYRYTGTGESWTLLVNGVRKLATDAAGRTAYALTDGNQMFLADGDEFRRIAGAVVVDGILVMSGTEVADVLIVQERNGMLRVTGGPLVGDNVLEGEVAVGSVSEIQMFGFGGSDALQGYGVWSKRLIIRGGDGGDLIIGGQQDDQLFGEGGDDNLNGQSGNDILRGGEGNDILEGGAGYGGQDWLEAGSANESATGGWNAHKPVVDGMRITDVKQGSMGNCAFLAALGAAVEAGSVYDSNIVYLGNFIYRVTFYTAQQGTLTQDVRFDGSGNNLDPLSQAYESWTIIYNRAYFLKFYNIDYISNYASGAAYNKDTNVGFGGEHIDVPMSKLISGYLVGCSTGGDYEFRRYLKGTPDFTLEKVQNALSAGFAMTAHLATANPNAEKPEDRESHHAYTLRRVHTTVVNGVNRTLVELYNPWGFDAVHGTGLSLDKTRRVSHIADSNNDGIISLTWEDFAALAVSYSY